MKQRYALRVQRGATVIGEYTINATPEGIRQLIAAMKPEFSFDILGRDGVVYSSANSKVGPVIQRWTRQRVGGTFGS